MLKAGTLIWPLGVGVMAWLFGTGVLVCAMTAPGALPMIITSITVIKTKAIICFFIS